MTGAHDIPDVSETDLRMMTRAITLAKRAAAIGEVPVGAVVYRTKSGQILGEGFNRRELEKDPAAHAEMIAVREASFAIGDWRLSDCSIAVTLEPCPMCAGLLVNSRVDRLLYGASDPKAGAVATLYQICSDPRLNHRVRCVGGVLSEECSSLLTDFFRRLRSGPARPDEPAQT